MKTSNDGPFRPLDIPPDPGAPSHSKMARKEPTPRRQAAKWVPLSAVPDSAGAPPDTHYKHGKPACVYAYRGAVGDLLGYVCRFDGGPGGKLFFPLTYCRNDETGTMDWRWKSWDAPRPLYGLDRLAARPGASVVIVEGEKAADAAGKLLPDYVAVTSPNGSKAARKADWSPLQGRKVVIWPDADAPGLDYAHTVSAILCEAGSFDASIAIVQPPVGRPDGWDAADALVDGWMPDQAADLVRNAQRLDGNPPGHDGAAKPIKASAQAGQQSAASFADPDRSDNAKPDGGGRRGAKLRAGLLELVEPCAFWHDKERRAFASVPVDGHIENMRLDGRDFAIWLAGQCHKELQEPVGEQIMKSALQVLEARAIFDGKCFKTFLRIGGNEGRIFLDLGRPDWRFIAIGADGWDIIDAAACPIKAIRNSHMAALPIPEAGELLESLLRPLVNVASDRDFRLIVGWLVAAFRDVGEYPILSINGEQGSAKSTLARMIRLLVDPNKAANRAAPRDERDLAAAAVNSHVVSLDNLSNVPTWLSDALCRIATGGGFSARANYTDMDEVVVHLENPIILNGIPEMAGRPDLVDRSIMISLPAIQDGARKSSDALWAEFEAKRPLILGALLDVVSTALRKLPETKLARLPRMANAALWVSAAEPALGWQPGTHIADLEANRRKAVETSLENEPVAIGIMGLSLPWGGTPTLLHEILAGKVAGIPKTAGGLGSALTRIKPVLSEVGITIERRRGRERWITIREAVAGRPT